MTFFLAFMLPLLFAMLVFGCYLAFDPMCGWDAILTCLWVVFTLMTAAFLVYVAGLGLKVAV